MIRREMALVASMTLIRSSSPTFDKIFITHLHGDHDDHEEHDDDHTLRAARPEQPATGSDSG